MTKHACISGATSGIGRATALSLARLGWRLTVGGRRESKLQELRAECLAAGASAVLSQVLDVTDEASVGLFSKAALAHPVDALINNAGLAIGTAPVASGSTDDWSTVINTNVMGLLRLTRAILPSMITSNSGHIVNMGSIAGQHVYPGGAVYCASKHAVDAITRTLRLELNGTKIRITSIDPGMVETEFSVVRLGDKEKADAVYKGMTPLTAQDIADCVVFAVTRPTHVNIDQIVLMPVDQASVYKVHRTNS